MMEFKKIHNQFLSEFQTMRNILFRTLCVFFLSATVFLFVPFAETNIGSFIIPLPGEGETLTTSFIKAMQADLVPEGVELIVLTPFDPFMAGMAVAAALAFLVTMPVLVFEIWRYVYPGLYAREKKMLVVFFLASAALFVAGAYFAYSLIIPATFAALYQFTPPSLMPFFSMRALVSLVAGMTVVVGMLFELPICMMILTYLRVVRQSFWRSYFRHALLLIIIASAIITPDGSGISMALLAVPICLAYTAGYVGSTVIERKQSASTLKSNSI